MGKKEEEIYQMANVLIKLMCNLLSRLVRVLFVSLVNELIIVVFFWVDYKCLGPPSDI